MKDNKNHQFRYDQLIPNLQNEELIKNIQEFFLWKLHTDFEIDLTKNIESQINNNLSKFGRKTPTYNPEAAVMCGIFIVEIIRTAGKIVRASFVNQWPKTAADLCKIFVQAQSGGNAELRKFIENPELVKKCTISAIERNVSQFSPDRRESVDQLDMQ